MNLGIESESVEFKKTTSEIKEACESICAMLNKHGIGTLYFGVKPSGEICGQDVTGNTLRDVSKRINESIEPTIYPVIEKVIVEDMPIIKVEFNGDDRPYSCKGKYYIRTADEDRNVSPMELRKMLKPLIANKWDISPSKITKKDIDSKLFKSFCNNAIQAGRLQKNKLDEISIMKRLGLYESSYYNKACEYLFGRDNPITLKMAVFATEEKLTFLDEKNVEGNIYYLLDEAEKYISKNIRWSVKIENLEREEIPEVPMAVIREVIANSFTHADYTGNTEHEICIFPNMITIYNPGSFASKFGINDYIKRNVQSNLRNEEIAKILYLSKNIERFASGLKRIDRLCKDSGLKYSYENYKDGFKFIIYRSQPYNNKGKKIISGIEKSKQLNKTELIVYRLLQKDSNVTRQELASNIAKNIKTIQRTLNSLEKKGIIRKEGNTRATKWILCKKIQ